MVMGSGSARRQCSAVPRGRPRASLVVNSDVTAEAKLWRRQPRGTAGHVSKAAPGSTFDCWLRVTVPTACCGTPTHTALVRRGP